MDAVSSEPSVGSCIHPIGSIVCQVHALCRYFTARAAFYWSTLHVTNVLLLDALHILYPALSACTYLKQNARTR